jgi:hypothetical protein
MQILLNPVCSGILDSGTYGLRFISSFTGRLTRLFLPFHTFAVRCCLVTSQRQSHSYCAIVITICTHFFLTPLNVVLICWQHLSISSCQPYSWNGFLTSSRRGPLPYITIVVLIKINYITLDIAHVQLRRNKSTN